VWESAPSRVSSGSACARSVTWPRRRSTCCGASSAPRSAPICPRPVVPVSPDKSIGAEETFEHDIDDPEIIRRELLRLAEKVGGRLRASGSVGRTISVKLRRADFTTLTRARTLREPTDLTRVIYRTSCELYEMAELERVPLRLVGVRVESLALAGTTPRQLALDEPDLGWSEAERVMDQAARRFGKGAVRPAALLRPGNGRDDRDVRGG
jgi:DNA polymerase IV